LHILWPSGICHNLFDILYDHLIFLWSFGTFYPFWYVVSRKIWQPCSSRHLAVASPALAATSLALPRIRPVPTRLADILSPFLKTKNLFPELAKPNRGRVGPRPFLGFYYMT
jgi:hypothetical protein